MKATHLLTAAVILALGFIFQGYFTGRSIERFKKEDRFIPVKRLGSPAGRLCGRVSAPSRVTLRVVTLLKGIEEEAVQVNDFISLN